MKHVTCGWLLCGLLGVCPFVVQSAAAQGFAPPIAAERMAVDEGLVSRLFASEPEIRQPILVKVDDRGRLWTIQYLQYPNPAGLKRVKVDRWSRTVYDRIPEPPPRGPRGADRITILEDTDRDGTADRFKDFVTGLNLVTGLAFGHGGVYVLQVPYLLFYPDRDRDDVPDRDPKVLLKGFGMEDAQSLANHLTWGPDGWLYGVNGSTTTCQIRGIEFQQGVWRYDPLGDRFELFCEGGGNTYGLTFDERGNLFYSTNGGPFVHALQGGYFYKSFGKHGPLHNPYAYGHLPHVERDQVPGGPPTGGTIYLGDSFPARYRGKFIAGNFLGHTVSWWDVRPHQTTFRATYGDPLLIGNDTWFGPTDVCLAPDGGLFVCDFYDQRTAHPDPDANWDRSNGRIYSIRAAGSAACQPFDLAAMSSDNLVDLLTHRNRWYADRARIELAGRRDARVLSRLRTMALQRSHVEQALQGVWALHASGGFDDRVAAELLDHPDPSVRRWTVRLLGDASQISSTSVQRLVALARREPSSIVRLQLAATAKRLSADGGVAIALAILARDIDRSDPRIPWCLWWAIEDKALTAMPTLLEYFAHQDAWLNLSNRDQALRLVRRWAAAGNAKTYDACVTLLETTPDDQQAAMIAALSRGLSERAVGLHGIGQGGLFAEFATTAGTPTQVKRRYDPLTPALQQYIQTTWQEQRTDAVRLELALRVGLDEAYAHLLSLLDAQNPSAVRLIALDLLTDFGRPDCVPAVLGLLESDDERILVAAIKLLGRFDQRSITERLLDCYDTLGMSARNEVRAVLLSRRSSARMLVQRVDQGQLAAREISVDQLRPTASFNDSVLQELVVKHWGAIRPGTPEERLATMRRFNNDLRAGSGDRMRGKKLFTKHCGTCHQLFGEGTKLGPDLTTENRGSRAALLANLVDPSAVIRRQYLAYVVQTTAGQVFTGLLAEQNAGSVTIVDAKNQLTTLRRDQIETLRESPVSLMPEKLLDPLTPDELRDLFAYLQGESVISDQ